MAHNYYSKKIIIAKIISNKKISDAHYILTIQDAWLATHFSAGQFVMLKTQDATTDPLLKRPFTIFSVDGDMVSVFYCVCGPATNLLAAKKSGETIEVLGPLGNGFSLKEIEQNNVSEVFLVGGGCGVATLFVLAGELKKLDCKINLYIGARTAKYICCAENFASLGLKINIATDDGSLGFKGYLPDLLLTHLQEQDNFNNKYIFASGPKVMLNKIVEIARQFNLQGQLSLEEYMACGIGICMGCSIETNKGKKLCCKYGPTVNLRDLV